MRQRAVPHRYQPKVRANLRSIAEKDRRRKAVCRSKKQQNSRTEAAIIYNGIENLRITEAGNDIRRRAKHPLFSFSTNAVTAYLRRATGATLN
jgi:hypothetical protein